MKLSVIIVNYNVKFFLEQCLMSVQKAAAGLDVEVWVVDNNSVDGSMAMVRERFPWVKCINNKQNVGFSRANNQAIRESSGEYILLLNPDTVLEEDTLSKSVSFMDAHPDAGGLGVKMVDGNGKFLRESKRSLPTPSVAFYKIFGLSTLFPKSAIFSRYHLGHLDENKTHKVEILAGAYMMLRKEALDKTGLLDESFFMYGEDIDLSYRLIKAGYKNYYLPETRIIHYKGESTKKSSVNYVLVFYKAMIIFARKHFSQKNARVFSTLIHTAIYLRAFTAIVTRLVKAALRPLADGLLIWSGLALMAPYYASHVQFPEGGSYPDFFGNIMLPAYTLIWILSLALNGAYRKPARAIRIVRGIASGTLAILALYALLDKQYQVSRAMILIGSAWAFAVVFGVFLIRSLFKGSGWSLDEDRPRQVLVIGNETEARRVRGLLEQTPSRVHILGFVLPDENTRDTSGLNYLGSIQQLRELAIIYKADEVIFCSQDLTAHHIIDTMSALDGMDVQFRIAPPEALFIIGSQSIEAPTDLYVIDVNSLAQVFNRRNKRFADVASAIVLLALTPFTWFMVKGPRGYLKNIFQVLTGKKTWVGYHPNAGDAGNLPRLRPGILTPSDALREKSLQPQTLQELNMLYARDYSVSHDLAIMLKGFAYLGRQ
ncbi:MAG: glycosyltransferase [Flavobacteriales bacterium]|nr:glycosyltransferase [Flavobacteriales bacterium]